MAIGLDETKGSDFALDRSGMKILVYGAGNIGRLYAGKLAASGCDVSILARGDRSSEIREHGIELQDGVSGLRSAVAVEAVGQLAADDAYDLVLVVLPRDKVSQVLPVLAKNRRSPNVMFFGNNVTGSKELVDALGPARVLLGFPGAGAVSAGRVVRYVITSKREQPTTIGELDGSTTARTMRIASALEAAGFPSAISDDMDAWLKTHAAEILPTVAALYRAAGDPDRLAGSDGELRLMLRSIREGYAMLRHSGVSITPAMHRMFDVLPEPALLAAMRARLRGKAAEFKLGHALHAHDEWTKLAAEFDSTFDSGPTLTPYSDVLFRQLAPTPAAPFISADVQRYIEEQLLLGGVVGCSIAVTSPAAPRRVFSFGMADLEGKHRVKAETRFHLFSGTKLYTAAAVMLLVERGQLDLDAPIVEHLPDLPVSPLLTVRHLASHASGLSDSLNGFLAVHLPGEEPPSATDALEAYRVARGKPPGGEAQYRNVNYAILGALVERVAGESYEDFVERNLLAPLGADLQFGTGLTGAGPLAFGHAPRVSAMGVALRVGFPEVARRIYARRIGGLTALHHYGLDSAAIGGLVGNATQFLPFVREMLSQRDGLLRQQSKKQILTLQSRGAAGIVSQDGVGLGWKRGSVGDTKFWNHEGGGEGFCSETRIYLEDAVGIVMLMNLSQSRGLSRCCHRICEAIRHAVVTEVAAAIPPADPRLSRGAVHA